MAINLKEIPVLSVEQIRKMNEFLYNKYGILCIQVMENAGQHLAELSRQIMGESLLNKRIAIAVGRGNSGGCGLVAARHLSNRGASVVLLIENENFSDSPAIQWQIVQGLPIDKLIGQSALNYAAKMKVDLILDALIGYSLSGKPRGFAEKIIRIINKSQSFILSLDIPSGLDGTTGQTFGVCVKAHVTLTLAFPKLGLFREKAQEYVGRILVCDIGIPSRVLSELNLNVKPIFQSSPIIDLHGLYPQDENYDHLFSMRQERIEALFRKQLGKNCFLLG